VSRQFGSSISRPDIVVTTGTFLRGLMHIGSNQQSGGRAGDAAAMNLSHSLKELGWNLPIKDRNSTAVLRRSIDFSKTEIQYGDEPVPYFTYWKDDLFHMEHSGRFAGAGNSNGKYPPALFLIKSMANCLVLLHLQQKTAKSFVQNLHKSPMYSGVIEGIGPRYCPSIEDKIVKFPEKERHQIFLEPEGH
jgi:tRNA uridine 5-carboxymethylaminomethyl modification enzyme